MSYAIAKSIKIDEKNGKIFIAAASNNVYPKKFETFELYKGFVTFKEKVIAFLADVSGGEIKPSRSNYRFHYAFERAFKELGIENFWNIYYLCELPIYYDKENGKPHWMYSGEEYALTAEQLATGDYELRSGCEQLMQYTKTSERKAAEQRKAEISDKFYNLFTMYYNEKEREGLFALEKNGTIIKPISEFRYRYGYTLDEIQNSDRLKKEWAMPYKKAYILAQAFDADVVAAWTEGAQQ